MLALLRALAVSKAVSKVVPSDKIEKYLDIFRPAVSKVVSKVVPSDKTEKYLDILRQLRIRPNSSTPNTKNARYYTRYYTRSYA